MTTRGVANHVSFICPEAQASCPLAAAKIPCTENCPKYGSSKEIERHLTENPNNLYKTIINLSKFCESMNEQVSTLMSENQELKAANSDMDRQIKSLTDRMDKFEQKQSENDENNTTVASINPTATDSAPCSTFNQAMVSTPDTETVESDCELNLDDTSGLDSFYNVYDIEVLFAIEVDQIYLGPLRFHSEIRRLHCQFDYDHITLCLPLPMETKENVFSSMETFMKLQDTCTKSSEDCEGKDSLEYLEYNPFWSA